MNSGPAQYYLPPGTDPTAFFKRLESLGRFQYDSPLKIRRTYLDTFDWRLHAAGGFLVEEQEPYAVRTCWRRLGDHQLLGQVLATAPRYAWDLPAGSLRSAIEGLIAMRALLPLVRMDVSVYRAALLNKRRKTILRFVIEEGMVGTEPGQIDQPLPMRLRLEPIKGYRKPLAKAHEHLQEQLGLESAIDEVDEALDLVGRETEDYSSKLEIALQPDMPAGDALRTILSHLLDTIERNLDGTRQDLDSEFLHDLRVAVRRTRSLFSQIKGVLPKDVTNRFRAGFKWLGQITGPTRDLDVYRLKLPGYRQSLPVAMQDNLKPLEAYLTRHQKQEQRKLARQLGSVRCRRLLDDWRAFLDAPADAFAWPDKAARPIVEIANRKTWKTYRLVLKEGMAIREDSPAAALHELRISCKKLRYLMEFFQSLYPSKVIRKQIKALKALQDNLGDFHDLEVQADALKDFGQAMQAETSDLPSETFMAMGVLIDVLHQRQAAERRNFAERFARFARPANQTFCRELFNPVACDKETT